MTATINEAEVERIADRIDETLRSVLFAPEGMLTVDAATAHRLLVIGLYEMRITPLGLRVRAHLERKP